MLQGPQNCSNVVHCERVRAVPSMPAKFMWSKKARFVESGKNDKKLCQVPNCQFVVTFFSKKVADDDGARGSSVG